MRGKKDGPCRLAARAPLGSARRGPLPAPSSRLPFGFAWLAGNPEMTTRRAVYKYWRLRQAHCLCILLPSRRHSAVQPAGHRGGPDLATPPPNERPFEQTHRRIGRRADASPQQASSARHDAGHPGRRGPGADDHGAAVRGAPRGPAPGRVPCCSVSAPGARGRDPPLLRPRHRRAQGRRRRQRAQEEGGGGVPGRSSTGRRLASSSSSGAATKEKVGDCRLVSSRLPLAHAQQQLTEEVSISQGARRRGDQGSDQRHDGGRLHLEEVRAEGHQRPQAPEASRDSITEGSLRRSARSVPFHSRRGNPHSPTDRCELTADRLTFIPPWPAGSTTAARTRTRGATRPGGCSGRGSSPRRTRSPTTGTTRAGARPPPGSRERRRPPSSTSAPTPGDPPTPPAEARRPRCRWEGGGPRRRRPRSGTRRMRPRTSGATRLLLLLIR
jgi:hypothetical protein